MEDSISLETRAFKAASILVGSVGLLSSVLNSLNHAAPINTALAVLTCGVGTAAYMFTLVNGENRAIHLPFILILMSISTAYWFSNNGYAGSTPIFLMALVVLSTILLEGKTALFVLGLLIVDTLFLIIFTHIWPELVIHPISAQNREFDISFTLFICMLATGALVQLFTSEYRAERKKNAAIYQSAIEDKAALQASMDEIVVLKGILPICSFCKKIKNDDSEWQDMGSYITLRSNAQFTHGFCPDCGKEHYGRLIK